MDSDDDPCRIHDATAASSLELCAVSQDGLYMATADLTSDTILVCHQWLGIDDHEKVRSRPTHVANGTVNGFSPPPRNVWRLSLSDEHLAACRRTWRNQASAIRALAFSPAANGQHEHILAIAVGNMVLLHDADTGQRVTKLRGNGRVIVMLEWSTHATGSAEIYDYWSNDDSPELLVLTMRTIDDAKAVYVQQPDHDSARVTFRQCYSHDLELMNFASQASMTSSANHSRSHGSKATVSGSGGEQSRGVKMRTISIATSRARRRITSLPERTRKDLQTNADTHILNHGRPKSFLLHSPDESHDVSSATASPATVVADEKMVSSLELPKVVTDAEDGSPMPFLSPAIPSRLLPPVDEQIDLATEENGTNSRKLFGEVSAPESPSLYRSREASFASTREPDSDSDDETFVPGTMHGSASFLPGGVNVPLPKGCGAVFAENGTLVTFFERRATIRVAETQLASSKISAHRDGRRKMAQLFPSFERVEDRDCDDAESSLSDISSDAGLESSHEAQVESELSDVELLAATSGPAGLDENAKFFSAVHDLKDMVGLPRSLASSYRFFRNHDTSLAAVCQHNAGVADVAEQYQHSTIWRSLAILVDENVSSTAANMTKLSLASAMPFQNSLSNRSQWGARAGGAGPWIVRQCLQWAEAKADVQLLALMSALIVQKSTKAEAGIDLGASTKPSIKPQAVKHQTIDSRPSTPREGVKSDLSPTKKRPKSGGSSRQSSKPTTPYLESGANTPSLPATLSRQSSSKLSTSPELHRSSFSAAARQYAQSITDRFATYGSSPPTKKISPSSVEELAESLKSKMGSWSKSVSFAKTESTVGGARDDAVQEGDAYDSDRTIEDVSVPQTPKSGVAIPVAIKILNEDVFEMSGTDDTESGNALLPTDLARKAIVWRRYYAEQLRCWGMLIEAAEMEKVGDSTIDSNRDVSSSANMGMLPSRIGQGSAACSFCHLRMRGLQQFCPGCQHAAHLTCVRMWLRSCVEAGEDYVCPAGCGCSCSRLLEKED